MGMTVYFDIVSGAGGDMILSSFIDAGVPLEYLQKEFAKLEIPGFTIAVENLDKSGIRCAHVKLSWDPPGEYRHIHDIGRLIENAGLSEAVVARAKAVLLKLAQAESNVHGIPVEEVHFHEIGAVDTIIDIVGAALCLDYLEIDKVYFSELVDGRGTVHIAHGVLPVPVPATAHLLQGLRFRQIDIPTELLTPTGCALLVTLGTQSLLIPGGTVKSIGYGCGTKDFDNWPNFLRAVLLDEGSGARHDEQICTLETDMDHVSGEVMGHVAGLLFEKGALDVSWAPVYMKKGRPAYRLHVVCGPGNRQPLIDLIMLNTRTLGVRYQTLHRTVASRKIGTANFLGTTVARKECSYLGHSFTKLEYDSLAALSRERGIPLLDLQEQFLREART